ncbi:Methyltransferase domain-containing protein [Bradyrhizobium erythrophlei]|nr:Methyltransferase domain-containing protein [Bradyrhizobium erythrophlei]
MELSDAPLNHLCVDHRFNRFWDAFSPNYPTFDRKSVLDIGCGEGSRCFEAAAHGASRVVGVDPFAPSISTALDRLKTAPSAERVVFFEGTLPMLPPEKFDLIISEDTLEHVLDVPELLSEIGKRLNPDGHFYLGFGPLYHAMDGDHGWMRAVLPGRKYFPWPWGHLLFEQYVFRKLSKLHGKHITNTRDWPYLSLNQRKFSEYQEMFRRSGLHIVYMRINNAKSIKGRLFAALRKVPGLSQYFTNNMYIIFKSA